MKKQIKSFVLVALFSCVALSAWSQASTEGREFWVALNTTTGTGGTDHEPFICITTQHAGGSYTITNPADPTFAPITGQLPPLGYIKIKASMAPQAGEIDLNKWYPVGTTAQAASMQTRNVGLKITTTVDCSVYAGNRLPQSFDAANILPVTALQTEYITQDYPGYDHENKGGGYPVNTILATEDNTQVTIIPSNTVLNNTGGTTTIHQTLNAGQVLYITGDNRSTLSGTVITSDKKIAVFAGVNNTDVPGPVSARDHLYEQIMPIDYWGTHFVVTRSMKKDANRVRVTAKENGTELYIDGSSTPLATINAGQTYEFELCNDAMRTQEGYTKANAEGRGTEYYFDGYAHYLETSCPCAVYCYDVSETYYIKKDGTSERDENAHGDPSMVWISPIEQQLRKITFGVMNTDKTTAHYVNIVTPTSGASSLEVREIAVNGGQIVYGNNLVQPSDIIAVPGNPAYSYARVKLTENKECVYSLSSDIGFIAHVYGSGDKESYAYSAGSAAVVQGVNVNGITFVSGYRSDDKFCVDSELNFDAAVGTDAITRVDWTFGDGTTELYGMPQTTHFYTSPGWYDVSAKLYGHQVCASTDEMELGTVQFSFRVVRADTIIVAPTKVCLTKEEQDSIITNYGQAYLDNLIEEGEQTILNPDAACYEDKQLSWVKYGLETEYIYNDTVRDGITIDGHYYDEDAVVTRVLTKANQYKCDSIVTCSLTVLTCLKISVEAAVTACQGENAALTYKRTKGHMSAGWFEIPGLVKEAVSYDDNYNQGEFVLPVSTLSKAGMYQGTLYLVDRDCGDTLQLPVNVAIHYPSSIFRFKFNNVLAVYQNAGYTFTAYQWYVNGQPVDGATESIYYLGQGEKFNEGDIVYVMLTDQNGLMLPSCPQTLTDIQDYNPEEEGDEPAAAAQKRIVNRRLVIIKGDDVYDIYGQKVQ